MKAIDGQHAGRAPCMTGVSFLAGEQSGFVSGQVIYAAGGPKA